jgi:hypothetical protein
MNWNQIGINRILEFLIRYEEIKEDALTNLQPPPNRITIYKQYYIRWLGFHGCRGFFKFLGSVQTWWQRLDPGLNFWPTDWMENFKADFLMAYPKTAGYKVIRRFGIYVLVMLLVPLWMIVVLFKKCICKLAAQSKEKSE